MRQAVADVFFDFTVGHEGFTPFMYCDTLNLVTTGVGNLIDAGPNNGGSSSAERANLNNVVSSAAMAPAMRLPWRQRGAGWTSKNPVAGDLVSPAEIADAWTKVKRQNEVISNFSQRGGFAYAGLTDITLDLDGMKELFNTTLRNFESTLASKYPGWNDWPADAQLATLSMSWAMGPNFKFPAFKNAVDNLDFAKAGELSFFKGGGGTLENRAGRNAENVEMFNNADQVQRSGGDPEELFFPVKNAAGIARVAVRSPSTASNGMGTAAKALAVTGVAGVTAAALFGLYQVSQGSDPLAFFKRKGWL